MTPYPMSVGDKLREVSPGTRSPGLAGRRQNGMCVCVGGMLWGCQEGNGWSQTTEKTHMSPVWHPGSQSSKTGASLPLHTTLGGQG